MHAIVSSDLGGRSRSDEELDRAAPSGGSFLLDPMRVSVRNGCIVTELRDG